jgi:hypothetical protein
MSLVWVVNDDIPYLLRETLVLSCPISIKGKRSDCQVKRLTLLKQDQLVDRGTSEEEIKFAIRDGEEVPAKKGKKSLSKES